MSDIIVNTYNCNFCPFYKIIEIKTEKKCFDTPHCHIFILDNICHNVYYKNILYSTLDIYRQFLFFYMNTYNIDHIYLLKTKPNKLIKITLDNLFYIFSNIEIFISELKINLNGGIYINIQEKVNNLQNKHPNIIIDTVFISSRKIDMSNHILQTIIKMKKNVNFNGVNLSNQKLPKNFNDFIIKNNYIYFNFDFEQYGKASHELEYVLYNGLMVTNSFNKTEINIGLNNSDYMIRLPFYLLTYNDINIKKLRMFRNIKSIKYYKNDKTVNSLILIQSLNNYINYILNNKLEIITINDFLNKINTILKLLNSIEKNNKLKKNNKIYLYEDFCSYIFNYIECLFKKDKKLNIEYMKILNIFKKSDNILKNCNITQTLNTVIDNVKLLYKNDSIPIEIKLVKNKQLLNKSKDFFTSMITCTNWVEELEENSVMGLILKVSTNNISKFGYATNINITNITTSFLPVSCYFDILDNYISDKLGNNCNINNSNIVFGTAIGNGNCIIPLYINKQHWKCSKKMLNPILGIIMAHNPFLYLKYHLKFMFRLMTDMNKELIISHITLNKISCYWALFRTVAEISFEKKYNRGIKKIVNEYINNPLKRIMNNEYDYTIMLGQIICTGYILEQSTANKLVEFILQELFRKILFKMIQNKKLSIKFSLSNKLEIRNTIDNEDLLNYINDDIKIHIKYLYSFLVLNKSLSDLLSKIGGYNQLIKLLDNNYGLMPEKNNIEFRNILKSNMGSNFNYTIHDLYNYRNTKYIIFNYDKNIFFYILNIIVIKI